MTVDTTGAGENAADLMIGAFLAGGIVYHLATSTPPYGGGSADVDAASVASVAIDAEDLQINPATGWEDAEEVEVTADHVMDVEANEEVATETIIQRQSDPDDFLLGDEENDPDLSALETYTVKEGTVVYEFGNPTD